MPIIYPAGGSGGGGGAGTVTNVSSPDTSIVVTNPTTTPSLKVATLDVIATNEPPAANWSNNSKKITSLANGSAAQDAAAFGQIPAVPVSSVFGRTGAVVAVNADYAGILAAALTGATAATRYVGGTASGPPVSGTFAAGDHEIDQTGQVWICTVAGTPGTWVQAGLPQLLSASAATTSDGSVTSGAYTDVTTMTLTFTPVVASSALCLYTAGVLFTGAVDVRLRQRFALDGGTFREGVFLWSPVAITGNRLSQSMVTLYSALSVAAHTIKVQQAFDIYAGNGVDVSRTVDRSLIVIVFAE